MWNEGIGSYTDPSVASQFSSFTINRQMVSCGVGTMASGDLSGPSAMIMYAERITGYEADHRTQTITVDGIMRSITEVGGVHDPGP